MIQISEERLEATQQFHGSTRDGPWCSVPKIGLGLCRSVQVSDGYSNVAIAATDT